MFNPYKMLRSHPELKLSMKQMPKELNGMFIAKGKQKIIVINNRLSQIGRRCALTHELAHYSLGHNGDCLHTDSYSDDLAIDKREYEAWVWAVDRLIDTRQYIECIRRDHQLSIIDICEQFRVTEQVLTFKAMHLCNIGTHEGYFFMPQ